MKINNLIQFRLSIAILSSLICYGVGFNFETISETVVVFVWAFATMGLVLSIEEDDETLR